MIIYSLAAGGKVSIARADPRRRCAGARSSLRASLSPPTWWPCKRGYPRGTFPGWGAVWRSLAAARCPGLFVVVIIMAGILSGVFTATESAAVAVLYAMLLTFVGYRTHDVGRTS